MRQTQLNLFKLTGLYLAKKVVFDLEAITNSVTLGENKNDLKITNVLSESICDEILDKLKKQDVKNLKSKISLLSTIKEKLKNWWIQKFKNILPIDGFGNSTRVSISKESNKVCRFIENIGIISSAWSVYPEGFSKYKIFSWFANQASSDLAVFLKACFIADFLLLSIAVLGFFYFFIVLQKDEFFVEKVLPFFKNLNFRQKMLFGSFTFFIAIPNKFWVNNKIHFIPFFVFSCIIYIMGLVFPILLFCYVMYFVLCLQSLIFAILYEKFDYFKRFSNWVIFGAYEEPFASEYFEWFWGNMFKKAIEKAAGLAAVTASVEAQRQRENARRLEYADKQTDKAGNVTKKGFETPQERADFHMDRRNEWTEENGTITWAIKKVKEYCNDSGFG